MKCSIKERLKNFFCFFFVFKFIVHVLTTSYNYVGVSSISK